jgi:hypothetical protein
MSENKWENNENCESDRKRNSKKIKIESEKREKKCERIKNERKV